MRGEKQRRRLTERMLLVLICDWSTLRLEASVDVSTDGAAMRAALFLLSIMLAHSWSASSRRAYPRDFLI